MTPGYIFIAHPDGRQQAIPLRTGVLRIGSAPDNDLALAGSGVAARHATIRCDDEGDLLITIGARDTRNNTAAMEIELPRAFATAMLVRIGGYTLRYQPAARPSHHNRAHTDPPPDEAAMLLRALLDKRIVWADTPQAQAEPHEAITVEMPALRGLALGE